METIKNITAREFEADLSTWQYKGHEYTSALELIQIDGLYYFSLREYVTHDLALIEGQQGAETPAKALHVLSSLIKNY
jgi:hypothetical protein